MFFKQLKRYLSIFDSKKSTRESNKQSELKADSIKVESERIIIDEIKKLIQQGRHKKALSHINNSINSGLQTNLILFEKASLLAHFNQYDEAHQIWSKLSKLNNKPKLSALAAAALEDSRKTQNEHNRKTRDLIAGLHRAASQFNQQLTHIPTPEEWSEDINIIHLIHSEVQSIRKHNLPFLSVNLLNQTLQSGLESPLFVQEKAISLSMMGNQTKALELLKIIYNKAKDSSLEDSIYETMESIKKLEPSQLDINKYLSIESLVAADSNGLTRKFLPETEKVTANTNLKLLIFKEARLALQDKPEVSLELMNSILNYFEGDLAALQLKGEALAALERNNEANEIWAKLTKSNNEKIASEASKLITQNLLEYHSNTNDEILTKSDFLDLIKELLKYNVVPKFNQDFQKALKQIDSDAMESVHPDLQQHMLRLQFNTLVMECFENLLHKQGDSNADSTAQEPGSIRKTAHKAG